MPYMLTIEKNVAPGYNVMSLASNGRYLPLRGTSMSTPIVAGAAALILSKNPNLTNDQVRDILLSSATDWGNHTPYLEEDYPVVNYPSGTPFDQFPDSFVNSNPIYDINRYLYYGEGKEKVDKHLTVK